MEIKVSIKKFDLPTKEILSAVRGGKVGLHAAKEWHRLYKPYVPTYKEKMYDIVEYEPWQITHTQPYSHYQYAGVVFGPSYPIQDGAAFFSPKGKKKHPTGRRLRYKNPRAAAKWDQAAIPTQGPKLAQSIQQYIDEKGIF